MPIKHKFQSGRADDGDVGAIQPSHWNGDHDLTGLLAALDDVSPAANTVLTFDEQQQPLLMPKSQLVPLNSPAFTGVPTAPTAPVGTNTAQIATMAAIANAISALLGGAPAALDTLKELADAINDDASYAATITNALALKAPLASPALSGTPTAPTVAGTADNTTKIATTAFVQAVAALLAPLASPGLTGTPTAPTVAGSTDATTKIATTAFVQAVAAAAASLPVIRNAFDNGALDIWQRGFASKSCPINTRTFLADRIYVNPQGAGVTQQRSASQWGASGSSRYCLEVGGGAGVTTVLIGQRFMADRMPALARTITVSARIFQTTGAAITPALLIGTPAASNDFTTVTNRLTANLQSVPNAVGTVVSWTGDISAFTNLSNGMALEFQVPTGVLLAGKAFQIGEIQVTPGSTVPTFERQTFSDELQRCQRHFYKSFQYTTAPAQAAGLAGAWLCAPVTTAAGSGIVSARFPVVMAGVPSVVTYNPSAANSNWRDITSAVDVAAAASDQCDTSVRLNTNATAVAGNQHTLHITAEYEP